MKKLIVGMLLVGSINVSGVLAETTIEVDAECQHALRSKLFERIPDLTDEQKVALQAMQENRMAERKARRDVKKDMQGKRLERLDSTAADYAAQVEQIAEKAADRARAKVHQRALMHEQLQSILTAEQLQALHEIKKKAKKQGKKAKGKKKKRLDCQVAGKS